MLQTQGSRVQIVFTRFLAARERTVQPNPLEGGRKGNRDRDSCFNSFSCHSSAAAAVAPFISLWMSILTAAAAASVHPIQRGSRCRHVERVPRVSRDQREAEAGTIDTARDVMTVVASVEDNLIAIRLASLAKEEDMMLGKSDQIKNCSRDKGARDEGRDA